MSVISVFYFFPLLLKGRTVELEQSCCIVAEWAKRSVVLVVEQYVAKKTKIVEDLCIIVENQIFIMFPLVSLLISPTY